MCDSIGTDGPFSTVWRVIDYGPHFIIITIIAGVCVCPLYFLFDIPPPQSYYNPTGRSCSSGSVGRNRLKLATRHITISQLLH